MRIIDVSQMLWAFKWENICNDDKCSLTECYYHTHSLCTDREFKIIEHDINSNFSNMACRECGDTTEKNFFSETYIVSFHEPMALLRARFKCKNGHLSFDIFTDPRSICIV